MTKEQAIAKLKEAQTFDEEAGHYEADKVLCMLLTELGHADVVAEWEKVGKWYA